MTSVQFEAAKILDVVARAEKAAPRLSDASERFAGTVIDVRPDSSCVIVRTTNNKVMYREVVDVISISGERESWRVSSNYLARIVAAYKTGSGDTIDFVREDKVVKITQGRKAAKLAMMPLDNYPEWYESDADGSIEVFDLGAKIKLIEWACSHDEVALALRITPDFLYATNKFVMARVPISIKGMEHPVTIEVGVLTGLIPLRGQVGFKLLGGQVLVTTDECTQIRCATIGEKYPPIDRALKFEFESEFRVNREELLNLFKTVDAVSSKDNETLRLFIGDNKVAAVMEQSMGETGIRDMIDVVGAEHPLYELIFNPDYIGNAVRNAPDDYITVGYNTSRLGTVFIDGASGYQCWVQPIDPSKAKKVDA